MTYSSFITNFQSPQSLAELRDNHRQGFGSNLEILLNEYQVGTEWTVPSDAEIGNVVFFMCAKSSVDYRHMAAVRREAREAADESLLQLAEEQFDLYNQYAGKIMVVGCVDKKPAKRREDASYPGWSAEIKNMILLSAPVDISEFKAFLKVSNTNAITKLDDSQYQSLMRLIESKNQGFLADFEKGFIQGTNGQSVPHMEEIIDGMSDEELESVITNSASGPAPTYTATVVQRRRDHLLPGLVKRRAKGTCQLCMKPAPFFDEKGKPYLEAHHIVPLAQNGSDDVSNMVALCPNCHRKVHVLKAQADIDKLKQVIASYNS